MQPLKSASGLSPEYDIWTRIMLLCKAHRGMAKEASDPVMQAETQTRTRRNDLCSQNTAVQLPV